MSAAVQLLKEKKEQAIVSITKAHDAFIKMNGQEGARMFEREKMFALMSITKNPDLLNCNPNSLYMAVANVAMSGLTLDPHLQLAHLVPRKGTAVLVVDYKGMIDAYERYASIIIQCGAVYEGDTYDYEEGSRGFVKHKRNLNRTGNEKMIMVYSIARFPDGRERVDIFDMNQVNKRKSKAATDKVWNEWPEEMAIKTLIRYQSKFLPKREQLTKIMELTDNDIYKQVEATQSEPEGIFDDNGGDMPTEQIEKQTKNETLPKEI